MATELSLIGPFTALAAGAISFLSPCVLPLVPAYVSYVVGDAVTHQDRATRRVSAALALSTFFVLGFSTIFVALGASASALGQALTWYRGEATIAGGIVIIVFGLLLMGAIKLPWLARDLRFDAPVSGGRPFGAYVMGLAFAFGWTPCIGPVLGALLTATALSTGSADGTMLLAVYSAGLGIPFLLTAAFTHVALRPLRLLRRIGRKLQIAGGGIMVVMGIAMITGNSTTFALWLLRMFPSLAALG